jgi:hypothetical protein
MTKRTKQPTHIRDCAPGDHVTIRAVLTARQTGGFAVRPVDEHGRVGELGGFIADDTPVATVLRREAAQDQGESVDPVMP